MQKKLLSLAIAGALAVPSAAIADVTTKQFDGKHSDITIYGKFHASWDYVDNDASSSRDDSDDNTAVFRNSRLGFKGTEDLGNGLKGIWQVETLINTGGDNVTLRNTYVGLAGDRWGSIKFGKHDTPYKMATAKLDIFTDTIADYNNIMGAHISSATRTNADYEGTTNTTRQTVRLDFNERLNQLLMYTTPNFNGFEAAIARESYQMDEDSAIGNQIGGTYDDDWEAWSLMAKYDANFGGYGNLFLSGAYEIYEGYNNHSADGDKEIDAWKIGLGYNFDNRFGNTMFSFAFEDIESDGSDNEATGHGAGVTHGSMTRESFYANFAHKFGNNVFKLAYAHADDSDEDGIDNGAENWSIGIDHNFSKRTKIYAIYTVMDNESEGDYGLYAPNNSGGSSNVISNSYYVGGNGQGDDIDAFSIGIIHNF